jgi:hypothetical protein
MRQCVCKCVCRLSNIAHMPPSFLFHTHTHILFLSVTHTRCASPGRQSWCVRWVRLFPAHAQAVYTGAGEWTGGGGLEPEGAHSQHHITTLFRTNTHTHRRGTHHRLGGLAETARAQGLGYAAQGSGGACVVANPAKCVRLCFHTHTHHYHYNCRKKNLRGGTFGRRAYLGGLKLQHLRCVLGIPINNHYELIMWFM